MASSIDAESSHNSIAILIDAENTPYTMISQILEASARFGRAIIRRAYGDWGTPVLSPWREIFKEHPITAIQQFHYVSGKNSSDSAMMIDAMDILQQKRVDTFILVTSDSDFTKLATRVREDGLRVIGIGRETAPKSFVKACDEFVMLENLEQPRTIMSKKDDSGLARKRSEGLKSSNSKDPGANGRELLLKAVSAGVDENGKISGARLGGMLRRLDPTFSLQTYGVRRLADFVSQYPDLLLATGETRGANDPVYQVVESESK
jgi:NYN domain/OST-HTH/LOTUS domain